MDLSSRVAIVTGSGQGLGLAYANELAAKGAAVVVNDVRPEAADAAVDEFGRVDITNAGVLRDKVVWKMTDEEFDQVLDVHMRGTFTCVRAAAIRMREQIQGGRIICVGSPAGQRGNFGQTNYAGAKSGVIGMVRTWAMELQRAGITVNAVVPVAATTMTETVPLLKPYFNALHNGDPLPPFARRELALGTAEDAAGAVAFLASDEASEVTGQALGVGGDRLALWSHPELTAKAYADGGWNADQIVKQWKATFAPHLESVGEQLPEEETA